jgi:hypothetical protein
MDVRTYRVSGRELPTDSFWELLNEPGSIDAITANPERRGMSNPTHSRVNPLAVKPPAGP